MSADAVIAIVLSATVIIVCVVWLASLGLFNRRWKR